METIVKINEIPLSQLVVSALSALNLESEGSLVGNYKIRGKKRYFEILALQLYQFSDMKPGSVTSTYQEWRNHDRFLDLVGGFHLHPYSRTTNNGRRVYSRGELILSDNDKLAIQEFYPKGIELLTAINPSKKHKQIQISKEQISATLTHNSRNYDIDIAAFYLEKGIARKAILNVKEDDVVSVFGS